MSLAVGATVVSVLTLQMLHSPLNTFLGYDQLSFIYNSWTYSYESPVYRFERAAQTVDIY